MALFERNVGTFDRGLRLALAFVLIGFALFCPYAARLGPTVQWVSGIVGVVALVTAATGSCLLYGLLGLRTVRR